MRLPTDLPEWDGFLEDAPRSSVTRYPKWKPQIHEERVRRTRRQARFIRERRMFRAYRETRYGGAR